METEKEYTDAIGQMRRFLEKDKKDAKKKLRDILPRAERLMDMYLEVSRYNKNKDVIDNILNDGDIYEVQAVGDNESKAGIIKRCSSDGTKEYTLMIATSREGTYAHFGSYDKIYKRNEFSFYLGRRTWVVNGYDVLDLDLKNDQETRGRINSIVGWFVKGFDGYEKRIYKKIGAIV